jgi:hypothetical protein
VVAGYVWYVRAQELFRVAVRDGKPSLIRGHAPTGLLGRFSDALSNVTRGEIRAHKPHVPADSTATRQAPSGGRRLYHQLVVLDSSALSLVKTSPLPTRTHFASDQFCICVARRSRDSTNISDLTRGMWF